VRKFRRGAGWLGGTAIVLGILGLLIALFLMESGGRMLRMPAEAALVLGLITFAEGCLWLFAGIFACCKRLGAMYTVLVLAYLKLVFNGLALLSGVTGAGLGVAIAGMLIAQGHNAIALAGQMRTARIPLDANAW
jgi:hypothetical protein